MINDKNFIIKLKKKDLKALDYLVDNYGDFVLKVSYSVLQNIELSEECTNDIMLKVWNNINYFKGDTSEFPKWLTVVTKRYAIDIIRKEKKHKNNVPLDENIKCVVSDIENNFERKTALEDIKKEIGSFEKNTKEIFIRRFFKGQRVNEISEELGISEGAVSNRLLRGKKKLSRIFGGSNCDK